MLRAATGGAAQITVYDKAGRWLGNYSATSQAQQQAIWLDNYPVALINVGETGVPELAYIQPDHLGTPRVVIDPVRDVATWEWSNKSEVFGNQAPADDPDGDGVAFELSLRFPGQQATDASGLYYNYQREYDPATGRYSQSDPIGLNAGISTYAYVESAPTWATDSLGLAKDSITAKIEIYILKGDVRSLTTLLESGILTPAQTQVARAGMSRLTMTAEQMIARELKGSVLREFPGQLRNKTFAEILEGARAGDKACQTARKLLTDGRFKK